MKTTKPKKAWKPKDGEKVYYCDEHCAVNNFSIAYDVDGSEREKLVASYNYFRTRRAAKKAARAVREVLKNCERG